MDIRLAKTEKEITACYPVMRELRPDIPEEEFVTRVQRQKQSGFHLALLEDDGTIAAVAGFRIGENLAWGRFLYVDDLVTSSRCRSRGHGSRLLCWLRDYAITQGCQELHLDSGMQRESAHRFYEREGMAKKGFHFVENLASDKAP